MNRFAFVLALALAALSALPAAARDTKIWRYNHHSAVPPFPLSERAASVWASGACWTDCSSHCTWGLAACLAHGSLEPQGLCLYKGDTCDRYCQRECRTSGGPYLPID